MTDIDLMSETQVAVMTVAAIGLWTALAWALYQRRLRARRRATYQRHSILLAAQQRRKRINN